MKFVIVVLVIVFANPVWSAVSAKQLARCAAIMGDLSRLECYDNFVKLQKLAGREGQQADKDGTGKWKLQMDTNPVDDTKTVVLTIEENSNRGRWDKPIVMVLKCQSDTTEMYVKWNDYLGKRAKVLTRIGSSPPETSEWGLSPARRTTFRQEPINFIKRMLKADRFVAQVTPYSENTVTAVFDTKGLKTAIAPLREACHW